MRQDARPFAGWLEDADDVEQVGVVALFCRWDAVMLEPLPGIVLGVDARAPAFVAERRIGDDIVEGHQPRLSEEERVGEGVALLDLRRGIVVQDQVHARQSGGGVVLLLTVERDFDVLPAVSRLLADLEEERSRPDGGIAHRGVVTRVRMTDAEDLGHDPTHFGGRVELALALTAFGGKVPHEVFVGVTEEVIAVGTVLGKVQGGVLEDGNEIGEPLHHLPAAAELVRIVEVRHLREPVLLRKRAENLLVDLVANVGLTLQGHHVREARAGWDTNGCVGFAPVPVADVFHKEKHQDVILVLAGIHAPAQFVAGRPQ